MPSPSAPKCYINAQTAQKARVHLSALMPAKSLLSHRAITLGGMEGSSDVVCHNERYCNHKP